MAIDSDDPVEVAIAGGDILDRIIDYFACSQAAYEFGIACAADSGHVCAKIRSQLDGICTDTTSRAIDENVHSRLDIPLVAQGLQGCYSGHRDCGGELVGNGGRFQDQCILSNSNIFGKATASVVRDISDHHVAWFEGADLSTHRFDDSHDIGTKYPALRHADPHLNRTVVERIHGCGMDAHQYIMVQWNRFRYFA